jgi:hypothetical protein
MLAAVSTPLGIETLYPVHPHETVFVTGGGGSIQKVPWDLPPDGDVHFNGLGALTEDDKNTLAKRLLDLITQFGTTENFDQAVAVLQTIPDASDRSDVALRAVKLGAQANQINAALAKANGITTIFKRLPTPVRIIWSVLATASFAASVYHGYKRNDSVGWAIVWGIFGALFPIITPTIAIAQGFGKPKHRAGFGRRRFSRNHRTPKYFRRRA